MILIVCVEKNGGMLFFGKRLSRDRILTEKILSETKNSRLVLTPYSAKLFPEDIDGYIRYKSGVIEELYAVCGLI